MITETFTTWLLSKIAPTIAALMGGLTLFLFWTPKSLADRGRIVSAFIAGGISATAGFVFSTTFLYWAGYSTHTLDLLISGGFFIGFISVGVFGCAANWIKKKAEQDPDKAIKSITKALT
jgi:high-affinity Fe2+/Pb2+ permease